MGGGPAAVDGGRREPPAWAEDEGAGARAGGRRRARLLQRIPVFSRELCIDAPENMTAAVSGEADRGADAQGVLCFFPFSVCTLHFFLSG